MKRPILALLTLAGCAAAEKDPEDRPHIVLIYADDLGAGDLGADTPNLRRLADEGLRFDRYYSASPICSPSRAGLITGRFPARVNLTSYLQTRKGNRGCGQADFLDPSVPALPRLLKAAGYATTHVGKWHLGGGRDVDDAPKFAAYGYDEAVGTYESPEPHPDITATAWIWSSKDKVKRWERNAFFVDRTLAFLRRHASARPCFVNLWPDDPHTPWVPGPDAPKGDTRENLRGVMIDLDRQIGRLLDGLRELGIEERTLVIFTSDNGPLPTFGQSRTGGLRGSKLGLYEGGIRLPFFARWPGRIPAGRVDATTVLSAVDLLPTLCALAGTAAPDGLDGEDLSEALLGAPRERTGLLFWEYGRNDAFFKYPPDRSPPLAVLDGRWKLLMGASSELYDVVADPKETKNAAAGEPELTERLSSKLRDWAATVGIRQ